jgi:hypothetical protein
VQKSEGSKIRRLEQELLIITIGFQVLLMFVNKYCNKGYGNHTKSPVKKGRGVEEMGEEGMQWQRRKAQTGERRKGYGMKI